MKTLIILIAISFITFVSSGVVLTLEWDANPPGELVSGYVVYEKIGTNWIHVANVQTNFWRFEATNKMRIFAVKATNLIGESPFSDFVECPAIASEVGGIKLYKSLD